MDITEDRNLEGIEAIEKKIGRIPLLEMRPNDYLFVKVRDYSPFSIFSFN